MHLAKVSPRKKKEKLGQSEASGDNAPGELSFLLLLGSGICVESRRRQRKKRERERLTGTELKEISRKA